MKLTCEFVTRVIAFMMISWLSMVLLLGAHDAEGLAASGGFGSKPKTVTKKKKKVQQPQTSQPPQTGSLPPVETVVELPQFMGGYVIEEDIVDGVVKCFEEAAPVRGMVSQKGGDEPVVDLTVKDSFETSVAPNDPRPEWRAYLRALNTCVTKYLEAYPFAGAYGVWALTSRTNIQRYPPSGGYKTFHTERTGKGDPEGSRHLVFMTYLNDVTDQGGTEFYHQNVTIQPRKGLTLVWPADWTFTHRGVPSPTQEKTITTGWFNFT